MFNFFRRNEYLYHGTTSENFSRIISEGLDPKRFTMETISLTPNIGFAIAWGKFDILIRVKKKDLDPNFLVQNIRYEYEMNYSKIIPSNLLSAKKVVYDNNTGNIKLENL